MLTKKGVWAFAFLFVLVFSVSFSSASWLSDSWGKITGKTISEGSEGSVSLNEQTVPLTYNIYSSKGWLWINENVSVWRNSTGQTIWLSASDQKYIDLTNTYIYATEGKSASIKYSNTSYVRTSAD